MKLTEEEIREIALTAIQELGNDADPELVKKAVLKTVEKLEKEKETLSPTKPSFNRIILIAFGLNRTNITAKITGSLSAAGCNIRDISQKMMDDFFTLTLLIDISNSTKSINEIQKDMDAIAGEMKLKIYLQHEDFFR